jgi:multiple sugar transport system permease protein
MTHTLVGATPGSPPVAAPAFAPATPEARQHRRDPRSLAPWLFLAPTLAAGLLFYAVPAVFLVWLSLADWDGFVPPGFAGLKNYAYLLGRDPRFLPTLGRTLVFVAGVVLATVPLALLLANLTYRAKVQALWRVVFCLPMVTHVVAVGYVGRYLFDGTHGAVSRLLDLVGVVGPDWLTRPGWAMAAVVLMYAWTLVGQNVSCSWPGWSPSTRACTRRRASTGPRRGSACATSPCLCSAPPPCSPC